MLGVPTIEERGLPVTFDRPFFMNRFVSTHQSLLLRSPKGDSFSDRIDILFRGVVAMKLLSRFQTLTVRDASSEESAAVTADCGADALVGDGLRIFMLEGGVSSGYVVALSMFASRDQRHGSNPSPLLFDVDGEPVPIEPFLRYG
jgi:hypothetical protein